MRILTIGFTKKTAEEFFAKLGQSRARRVIDVRLKNQSQLAGFAKKDDLRYFLRELLNVEYMHLADLAPTEALLSSYKKHMKSWADYEKEFQGLMEARRIEKTLNRDLLDEACLLCSEERPDRCHRRLVAEYLREKWKDVEIVHIV